MRTPKRVMALAFLLAGAVPANADHSQAAASQQQPSAYMRVFGTTLPPHGFVQFCASHRQECLRDGRTHRRFQATPALLSVLDEVNRTVNEAIRPATDQDTLVSQPVLPQDPSEEPAAIGQKRGISEEPTDPAVEASASQYLSGILT